jgi:hypothetical protein
MIIRNLEGVYFFHYLLFVFNQKPLLKMDKQKKRLSLNLNKEVITQLDKAEAAELKGGDVFLSLFGSKCYNTNPLQHNCCTGVSTQDPGACTSTGTVQQTAIVGTCCCNPGNPGGGTGGTTGGTTGLTTGGTTGLSLDISCQP